MNIYSRAEIFSLCYDEIWKVFKHPVIFQGVVNNPQKLSRRRDDRFARELLFAFQGRYLSKAASSSQSNRRGRKSSVILKAITIASVAIQVWGIWVRNDGTVLKFQHGRFNPLTAVVQDGVVNPESAGLSEWGQRSVIWGSLFAASHKPFPVKRRLGHSLRVVRKMTLL